MRERRSRRSHQAESSKPEYEKFLSTGSTMLNLSISDQINGGWPMGKINTIPGQSTAGKTILALHSLTEAAIDSKFDEYELILDDVERRISFDLKKMFPPLWNRLITPTGIYYKDLLDADPEKIGISNTIQEFQARILTKCNKGIKFIWVVDSLDALTTDEELKKEMERAGNLEKGKETKTGTYAMEKAKYIHKILRTINGGLANTDSLLLITQQLRQKIDPSFGEKHWYTNGGEGPYFYSHARPFLKKGAAIKKLNRVIGRETTVDMDKNSVSGKYRTIKFNVYYDMGIDDVGSMVQFLLDEEHWKSGSWIEAREFELRENGKDALVRAIEEGGHEKRLKRLVQRKWNEIEESLKLNRKPRYSSEEV
jgi:recombination protein RecA